MLGPSLIWPKGTSGAILLWSQTTNSIDMCGRSDSLTLSTVNLKKYPGLGWKSEKNDKKVIGTDFTYRAFHTGDRVLLIFSVLNFCSLSMGLLVLNTFTFTYGSENPLRSTPVNFMAEITRISIFDVTWCKHRPISSWNDKKNTFKFDPYNYVKAPSVNK